MEFVEAKKIMDQKLGAWKIMALASCVDNYPMVRNVSCIFYNDEKCLKNFIPCYSTITVTDVDGIERSKDTVGLYDTVEGKFYVNESNGYIMAFYNPAEFHAQNHFSMTTVGHVVDFFEETLGAPNPMPGSNQRIDLISPVQFLFVLCGTCVPEATVPAYNMATQPVF